MTDDPDFEEYRNSLDEIIDGGGCMEALEATDELREELSRKDFLGGPTASIVAEDPADEALAAVDADEATRTLRARYDSLDALRTTLTETVTAALLDRLDGMGYPIGDPDYEVPVCLKTFNGERLPDSITLVPHVTDAGAIDRLMARPQAGVVLHAVPETGEHYAVVGGLEGHLITPEETIDLSTVDLVERVTGIDCDEEVSLTTRYVQRETPDGIVVETTCEAV